MSKMLVAYDACGCRVAALLDATDEQAAAEFVADCSDFHEIRKEDRADVGARRCIAHHDFVECPDVMACKLVSNPIARAGHVALCHYGAPGEECGGYIEEHGQNTGTVRYQSVRAFVAAVQRALVALQATDEAREHPDRIELVARPFRQHVERLQRAIGSEPPRTQ